MSEEQTAAAPADSKLVPIDLHNINLHIELRVPAAAAASFEQTQTLVQRLRETFGEHTLIEELQQLLNGTVEKVSISRPDGATGPVVSQPVQVNIPQTQNDYGNYQIQSTSCPWTGQCVKNLSPESIYKVLYESQVHRNLLTAQDIQYMEAYYKVWYEQQSKKN